MSHLPQASLTDIGLLLFCIAGIYSAYLTQGFVSEHLATKRYGPEKEHFGNLEGLTGAQSLCCFIWAYAILQTLLLTGNIKANETGSWTDYYIAGITNSLGPSLGMIALKNISYSAQVLVKSCKMVPVMLVGTLLYQRYYSPAEYVCMTLVGVGVALFGSKSSRGVTAKLVAPNQSLGYFLCGLNLLCDGFTNVKQDAVNRKHPRNPPIHMMCWMNFWTTVYYVLYMVVMRKGFDSFHFCVKHPDAAWDVFLFCICGALGQLFIFFTIKTFGSLTNTLICTTRKFFNILISVLVNGNALLSVQWAGVVMVFTGLICQSLLKAGHHRQSKRHQAAPATRKTDLTANGKEKHQ